MKFQLNVTEFLIKLLSNIAKRTRFALDKLVVLRYALLFEERDSDIYVATYLKSGTTWMQMILYQLTTDGNMDFNHIYDVSPWIRNEAIRGEKPRDLPEPRVIKTHDHYTEFNKDVKGRFIYVYRDGKDVAVSLLHHVRNYNNSEMTLDKVMEEYFDETKDYNWFKFNRLWMQNKDKRNILYVRYEDLQHNFDATLQRIIAFLNLQVDAETLARVKERSSFAYMKQFQDKFGEQPTERDKRRYDQFIRKGKTGEGKEVLTPEQQTLIEQGYAKHVLPFEMQINRQH